METHDTQSKRIRSWKTIGEVASFMIICGFLIQVTDPGQTPEKLNGCWKSTINGRTMYVNFVSNTQADLFLVENGTLVACERCAYISSFWDYSIQFQPVFGTRIAENGEIHKMRQASFEFRQGKKKYKFTRVAKTSKRYKIDVKSYQKLLNSAIQAQENTESAGQ